MSTTEIKTAPQRVVNIEEIAMKATQIPAIRVMHLVHNLKREGAQIVLKHLVESQLDTQISPMVCAWRYGGELESQLQAQGAVVITNEKPLSPWTLVHWVHEVASRYRVDLIHAHLPDSTLVAALVRLRYGTPFIVTHHSTRLVTPMPWKRHYIRLLGLAALSHLAQAHVAISARVGGELSKLLIPKRNITVITNGVPLPEQQLPPPDLLQRRIEASTRPEPLILGLGRLEAIKGFDQLLQAFSIIAKQYPNAHLYLVGEGSERPVLEQLRTDLGLHDRVTFTGSRSDVPHWLAHSDLLVNCSKWEGIPMALLEAMAWRVPVIASDVPGNQEVVTDRKTGWRYPWGNTADLAKKITEVLSDTAAQAHCTEAAYQQIQALYSRSAMSQAYAALYSNMTIGKSSLGSHA